MKERSVNFFGEKNQANICNVFAMVEKIFYLQSTAPDSIALSSFSH